MMSNIGIIGASSYLGQYMTDYLDAYAIPGRFGWHENRWMELAEKYKHLDTIVILSRACRKEEPRRDERTMTKEIGGLAKILHAFHDKRIVYTSSRVVNLANRQRIAEVSRHDISVMVDVASRGHLRNKVIHIPTQVNKGLDHMIIPEDVDSDDPMDIYAMTKICGEILVKSCCKDYTIFRIWDII